MLQHKVKKYAEETCQINFKIEKNDLRIMPMQLLKSFLFLFLIATKHYTLAE